MRLTQTETGPGLRALAPVTAGHVGRKRKDKPGIFAGISPATKQNAPTGLEPAFQVGECGLRLTEEHGSEAREQKVRTIFRKRVNSRIGKQIGDWQVRRSSHPSALKHIRRDVDADDLAIASDHAR